MSSCASQVKMPLWARGIGYVLSSLTVLYIGWIAVSLWMILRGQVEDTTASRVSSGLWREHLNIPSEATLVRSEKFRRMVEDGERFEFSLPATKTPETWMAEMVKGRQLGSTSSRTCATTQARVQRRN